MKAESPARQCYAAIRRELGSVTPITVLHIGTERSVVVAGIKTPVTGILAIGSRKTASDRLQHNPPTPHELEQAIADVEDEVVPLRAIVPDGSSLHTPDEVVGRMAAGADEPGALLSIERVEQLFNQLAAIAEGRPASAAELPPDGAFYATVLILREFMHHLGFASIALCAARQGRVRTRGVAVFRTTSHNPLHFQYNKSRKTVGVPIYATAESRSNNP